MSQQQATTVEVKNNLRTTSKKVSELETKKVDLESSLKEERLKAEEIKSENERLKANLQAKKESQTSVAPKPTLAATNVTGDKYTWLAASGIPESEWQYVDFIVSRESGWNPNAVNPSSGACGLGQQLPCGKWPGAWNDPVAALKAQYGYVNARYGGYAGAYSFWLASRWY